MADKTPIRTVFDNGGNAVGLSEFQTGETVGYEHGGTGLSALGSAGQVLKVNDGGTAIEWANDAQSNLQPYLQVANANISFVTKSTALASNNALIALINDRMQVANVQSLVSTEVSNLIDAAPAALDTLNELAAAIGDDSNFITTITTSIGTKATNTYVNTLLANTNSFITEKAVTGVSFASSNNTLTINTGETFYDTTIDVSDKATWTALLETNTAIRVLVSDRLQVANADALYVTKSTALTSNNALNNLVSDRIQVANAAAIYATKAYAASNTFVNQTFETKAVALSSNTAQNVLINDRLQVANADVLYVTKSTALASNNAVNNLISDRIQVANATTSFAPKRDTVNTVTANTSLDTTNHGNIVVVNASNTVTITVDASSNLTVGDKFTILPVGTGQINVKLDVADVFLGTKLSLIVLNVISEEEINPFKDKTFNSPSFVDSITTGVYTKVEVLYIGEGNFVLIK